MVKIGHASIDERNQTKGGVAGDQTGREVLVSSWYSKKWKYVLRPKDKKVADKMADACEKGCNNPAIGYDQSQRNTLRTYAILSNYDLSIITAPCECDCSSFMTVCAECAGIKIPYSGKNAPTTSTMQTAFMSTGAFTLLTDSKYLTGDAYLKRGDILVAPGSHTVMALEDGTSTNNLNAVTGSKAVDISQYNTITDYKAMVSQLKNVLIRVGYRSYEKGILTEDKSFKKHIENCISNNANVGIYFYDQSLNENESVEQAKWVLDKIKPYAINLPIFIDSEYSNRYHNGRADAITKEQRTKNCIAFCDTIKKAGYECGVYASDSWFKSMLEFDKLKNYLIWCARYSVNKPTISKYDMWQYGSEMYSWATGAIDTNNIYTDLKIKNVNGGNNSQPTVTPTTPTPSSSGLTPEKAILLMGQVNIEEGTLNVRKLPTTDSPVVIQLKKDQYVQLRGDLGTWYRMDMGYVSKKYIKEVHGIVTGDNLRVRSTPDSSLTTNIITTLPINTEVIVCTAGNGWYYVLLNDGTTGWVSGQYLKLK